MLSEYQLELLPERICERLSKINTDCIINIAEVLKKIGELRPTDVHQLQQMYNYGADIDQIIQALSAASEKNIAEIEEVFEIVAKANYDYSTPFYEAAKGKTAVPYEKNTRLKRYVSSVARQTVKEYKNLTQHTAFAVFEKDGKSIAPLFAENKNKAATSISETYTKIIDLAVQKVQTGTSSYQQEMRNVMSAQSVYYTNGEQYFVYRCSHYSNRKNPCTNHHIRESVINQLVIHTVKRILRRIIQYEKAFCEELKQQWEKENQSKPKRRQNELTSAKQRLDELDVLITGLYENYISNILPERQYKALMIKYSAEQSELEEKVGELQKNVDETKTAIIQPNKFIKAIKKYKEPTELTAEMLNDLVDKIVIHEKTGDRSCREQEIDIYFNFIGKFDLAYSDEELAEQKQLAEQAAKEKAERKAQVRKLAYIRRRDKKRAERLAENDGHMFAKRNCAYCGKEFYPNSSKHIFCCTECKEKAKAERIAKRRFEEKGNHLFKQRNCILCGTPFWPSNGQERLCSPECKAQNRREKQLAYYHRKKENSKQED